MLLKFSLNLLIAAVAGIIITGGFYDNFLIGVILASIFGAPFFVVASAFMAFISFRSAKSSQSEKKLAKQILYWNLYFVIYIFGIALYLYLVLTNLDFMM